MLLAIGDVVRIRSDKTLGTVVGVATHDFGNVVDIQVNDLVFRPVRPADVEVVARAFKPMTGARAVATLLFLVLGIAAAAVNGHYVRDLGANWAMTFFVTFTSVTSIAAGLIRIFNRPRRVQV